MVDRGANGGLAGSVMHVIHKTHRKINIQGIDNHEVTGLDAVTAATLLNTSQGKVIGIFIEYAYLGKGSSIHSSGHLEWFKTNVDEKSVKVGGTQLITTLDGYSLPLLIKDGLAYATSLGKPTDQDMDTYPHVFFTSPDEWDPSVLDHDPPHLDGLDPSQVPDQPFGDPMFDAYGDFNERIIANLNILLDAPPEDCGSYTEISSVFTANLHQSSPQEPDWNALRPFFAWTSPSSIKDTFNVTTRHGTAPHAQDYIKKHFKKHFKSRNPVFNIPRGSEAVATDTIFSDTQIHFSGPYDEDEYQNLISDDNQVIQQENFCSEHPEPLSYSLFQSHFQGSSTSNTQKTFLPKPTWERPSKDQQQMIIDHKPNSGSPHLSTPNKSPSPSPHLPTPQQTAKPQQVHTHQSDESTTDTTKTETTPSDPLLAMAHQSINTSDDAAPDISNVLSVERSSQIQVCRH